MREVKTRITKSVVYSESFVAQAKKEINEIKNNAEKEDDENTPSNEEFEAQKQQIIDDSNTVLENLKVIENDQEECFQAYLKKLGNALVNTSSLKNISN